MAALNVDEFLSGPLVTWFSSYVESFTIKDKLTYDDIIDGVLMHNVFQQMELHVQDNNVSPSNGTVTVRLRNLQAIMVNMRIFYEDEMGHVILRHPDIKRLAEEPMHHARDAELLLCLLLGCAVQCPEKQRFILGITMLDETTQTAIAEYITQVIDVPEIVLSPDMVKGNDASVHKAFEYMLRVTRERNAFQEKLNNLTNSEVADMQRYNTELLVLRSKVTIQGDELKEKSNEVHDYKNQLEQCKQQLSKLERENERLITQVRSAKFYRIEELDAANEKMHLLETEARSFQFYRDELDAAREKIDKVNRLEQEVARQKEKLAESEFYKTRLCEVLEDNRLLSEAKEILTEEVSLYKVKAAKVSEMNVQMLKMEQQIKDLSWENKNNRDKNQQLSTENLKLFATQKSTSSYQDNNIAVQLTNYDQSMSLRHEVQSRRLPDSTHGSILDSELEKQRLMQTIESLREDLRRSAHTNQELEGLCKKALASQRTLLDKKQATTSASSVSGANKRPGYHPAEKKSLADCFKKGYSNSNVPHFKKFNVNPAIGKSWRNSLKQKYDAGDVEMRTVSSSMSDKRLAR